MGRHVRTVMRAVPVLIPALLSLACHARVPPSAAPGGATLAFVVVQPQRIAIERRLEGVIEAVHEGTLTAQTSGRVDALYHDVNDRVPAGTVLVRLRAVEQHAGLSEAQAALVSATAQQTAAQAHFLRTSALFAQHVLPRSQLDQATAARDSAVAAVEAARARVDAARAGVSYTEVRAPYAEVITQRLVHVGESVAPGTGLISGLSLANLRATVDIPQSIFEAVRSRQQAALYIGERRIEATHLTVFPQADAATGTVRVRLDLPADSADLYPGMLVKAAFVIGEAQRLLVPQSCLVTRGEVTALYVVDPQGRVSMRQVRLGDRYGDQVAVLAGLQPGERVATDPMAAATRPEQQADSTDGAP